MMTKKVFIYTAPSCDGRFMDAQKFSNYFSINGHQIVTKPDGANLIILVTCGFSEMRTEIGLRLVKKFQHFPAELVVCGCLPETDKEKLRKIFGGKTIATHDLDKNPEKIDELFPENKIKFSELYDTNSLFDEIDLTHPSGIVKSYFEKIGFFRYMYDKIFNELTKHIYGEHSHMYKIIKKEPAWYLRISWGCLGNCSYCAIRKAIGKHKSKPIDECLKELKIGIEKGFKKIIIISDNAGLYGVDTGSSLPELLEKITDVPGNYRIVIKNLDPFWVVKDCEYIEKILKKNKISMIEVPIQSGCKRILNLMNRYSDIIEIKKSLVSLKQKFPNLTLKTHIVAGFPTETREEFLQTLSCIKEIKFDFIQLFAYSSREDTKANSLEPKLNEIEMSSRMKEAKKFFKNESYVIINPSISPNRFLHGYSNKYLVFIRKK